MKRENVLGYIVIALLALLCVTCVICEGLHKLDERSASGVAVNVDWESMYPFEDGCSRLYDTSEESTTLVAYYVQKFSEQMDSIETKLENSLLHFPAYLQIQGEAGKLKIAWASAMEYNMGTTKYVKTDDGYIIKPAEKTDEEELQTSAEYVAELRDYCDGYDIPFLYVQCPTRSTEDDGERFGDASYENENVFVSFLQNNDVDVLNLQDFAGEDWTDWHTMFYKTDYHWTPQAGLWAAGELVNVLNDNYGFEIETGIFDERLYESVVYEDAIFADYGRAVGHAYVDSEDFEIPIPSFETSFRVQNLDMEIDMVGAWQEVMYDEDEILADQADGGGEAYSPFLGGLRPLTQITNFDQPDGIKILMIRDSFASVSAPYLAIGVSELDLIDVRASRFTGSIRSVIDQMQPDIVIMFYSIPPTGCTFE